MMIDDLRLSVIMPVFNESSTIDRIIEKVRRVPIPKEVIVVDDCSTDGTREILQSLPHDDSLRFSYHDHNRGKGAAVRTGLKQATGNVILIQDADLEYDPDDYHRLHRPIIDGDAKVVYGSRFLGEYKGMCFWHMVGNKFLTLLTNALYGAALSDMETCYKVFVAEIIKGASLKANRFDIEPEITARILRTGCRIHEVPISYDARGHGEGKKISWKDGVTAAYCLLKYRFLS